MPPKPQKPKVPQGYKTPALIKDVLPSSVKNPPREGRSVRIPDAVAIQQAQTTAQQFNAPIFEEFSKFEEWPGDEAAKIFDFNIEGTTQFLDQSCNPFRLTPSLCSDTSNLIFWRRPSEFIQTENEEINTVKSKYHLRRRTSTLILVGDDTTDNSKPEKHKEFSNSPTKIIVDDSKVSIRVFEFYEREETLQEGEQRKKEQAEKAEKEKKAKKPVKKEDPVEEKPGMVRDIRLNNIDMSYQYPEDSKWIASQLQLIKDRHLKDCYTNKEIWTKIYPQQDGIPVLNKTGRYWVKLYYLGKERKIEIDDRMPVNFKGQCKFPRSVKKEEIWTCIFSKAIFKLLQLSQDISYLKNLCGSGFVMYSLTGMMSQTIPMHLQSKVPSIEWQQKLTFLRETLSDQHFNDQDIILTAYCLPNFLPRSSNKSQDNSKKKDPSHISSIQEGEDEGKEEALSRDKDKRNSFEEQLRVNQGRTGKSNQMMEKSDSSAHLNEPSLDQDQIQPRSPIRRNKKRNLTMGGIARSSTQIFDTIHQRIKHESSVITEDDDDDLAQGNLKGGNASPSKSKQMAAQLQKASSIIQSAAKDATSQVISGFSYPVLECFFNDNFNMVYVQKRSEKEIRLRQEYVEHSNQSINKMNKEEKIEHRRKKKELRDRIADEEKKRIELITRPPIQYKFFRIKSRAGRVPPLNICSPFSTEEIQIAKTCIINKHNQMDNQQLSRPPNYQEGVEMRDDGKSVISSVMKNNDESLTMKPLDDFSSLNNFIEPANKGRTGIWIQDSDLQENFQYFQLFYNPTKYPNHCTINVSQAVDSEITVGEDHEVLLVERNSEIANLSQKIMLLFGFTAKQSKTAKILPEPYCILQKFDFGSFNAIHEFPPLRGNQSSQLTEIENSNQVFKILVYTPVSFSLSISCTNTFKTMSVLNYLTEYEGYLVKNFNIEYQAMEEKRYHVLFRFRIPQQEFESLFFLKVKSTTDNQMLKYMRLKLVEEDTEGQGVMLNTLEGVNKNLYESTFTLSNYLRLQIRERTNYFLVLEGEPPYSIAEGALSIDFYTKNSELSFENLEHVEPLQYSEKYLPTKYGIIFREKIYVSEKILASFHLKIMDVIGQLNSALVDPKKKGAKPQGNEASEILEKEIEEKHLIKMELFENGKSIIYNIGQNQTLLSNVILKSTKSEQVQYLLEATFDLHDWPSAKTVNALTENMNWFLKIISTDTVGVVKDTDKEDQEKAIKKSWEDGEVGRSEKSKKARRKFQILIKQSNGEKLTEEELLITNEPRLSKKQREELIQQNQAGVKKQAKKEDKKPVAPVKGKGKEDVVEEKKEIKVLPLSQNHRTNEIKSFLEHMEEERVSEQLADHPGLIDVRSEKDKQLLNEQSEKAKEEVVAILTRNNQLREELKQYQLEQIKSIQTLMLSERATFKESWSKFLEQREEAKGKMSSKTVKEKEIIDILRADKPSISLGDLEKLIADSLNIPDLNAQLIETAKKLVKNMKIQSLSDRMTEGLAAFNLEQLTATMEDFHQYSVTGIDPELIKRVEEMLSEANTNPNFAAEKLQEQKKAGKKGKK